MRCKIPKRDFSGLRLFCLGILCFIVGYIAYRSSMKPLTYFPLNKNINYSHLQFSSYMLPPMLKKLYKQGLPHSWLL